MLQDFISLGLGFIEGFALILSPCILPILPIILAGSLSGSKQRPLGIISGFVLSFALFSYFAHTLVGLLGVDLTLIRCSAYVFLLLFGVTLLSHYLSERFNQYVSKCTARMHIGTSANTFLSGFFIGTVISIIWTPCAGPILAAVIVQIAIQQDTWISFLTLLSFALGAAIPMLIIVFYSLRFRDGVRWFTTHVVAFRQGLGVIIILNALYLGAQELGYGPTFNVSNTGIRTTNYIQDALWRPYPCPSIAGITHWINGTPQLKGKVILIDFWTYSCINCLRTIPYLNDWYQKYHQQGFEIVGIHSPEFDFEHQLDNVQSAVTRNKIKYPVGLDNDFVTWRNFSNQYWPAHYLINQKGEVVYEHFGEGDYDIVENNIRFLLGQDYTNETTPIKTDYSAFSLTPETYLGFERSDFNANNNVLHDQSTIYSYPQHLRANQWALQGSWLVEAEKIRATQAHASIKLRFNARYVYVVMGGKSQVTIRLILSGKVIMHQIKVDKYSIYKVIELSQMEQGIVELSSDSANLEVYTFTFGG